MRRTPSTEARLDLASLMFPLGCRILPGKHLHIYSGGANFVELRYGEVRRMHLLRTRVSTTNDGPQTTLAVAPFEFGPYRLSPGVPSSKANTKSTITPISGTKPISIHQPERSMSWSLLTVTAKVGMRTARL